MNQVQQTPGGFPRSQTVFIQWAYEIFYVLSKVFPGLIDLLKSICSCNWENQHLVCFFNCILFCYIHYLYVLLLYLTWFWWYWQDFLGQFCFCFFIYLFILFFCYYRRANQNSTKHHTIVYSILYHCFWKFWAVAMLQFLIEFFAFFNLISFGYIDFLNTLSVCYSKIAFTFNVASKGAC